MRKELRTRILGKCTQVDAWIEKNQGASKQDYDKKREELLETYGSTISTDYQELATEQTNVVQRRVDEYKVT